MWKGLVNNFRLAKISAKLKALDEWLGCSPKPHPEDYNYTIQT